MPDAINYWPLLGVAVVVAGFALRHNPVLAVVVAGIVSALAAGISVAAARPVRRDSLADPNRIDPDGGE